jgi:hypothetical protein
MSEMPAEPGTGQPDPATGEPEPGQNGEMPDGDGDGEEGQPSPEELASQVAHWKSMARKNEDRAKANADAAKELKAIKDAGKSELERAQEALAETTRERDEARASHERVMAAAMHDLPVELIDDLGSGTSEEISARAERFATAINSRAQQLAEQIAASRNGGSEPWYPGTGRRPVESLRPGSAPASGGTPATPDGIFRKMVEDARTG